MALSSKALARSASALRPSSHLAATLRRRQGGGQAQMTPPSHVAMNELQQIISDHYDGMDQQFVDSVWGDGNYHFGFYPHLEQKEDAPVATFEEATAHLTRRMAELGGITRDSVVLDFGCGRGGGTLNLCKLTGCSAVGVDLSPVNIAECEANAKLHPDCDVAFVEGSFTSLPEELHLLPKFTHVFSQHAIYHVHEYLDLILDQAHQVLREDGRLVWSDWYAFHAPSKQSPACFEKLYKRLDVEYIAQAHEYLALLHEKGFLLDKYEDLTPHGGFASRQISAEARSKGHDEYADDWSKTASFFENREVGVNFMIAHRT